MFLLVFLGSLFEFEISLSIIRAYFFLSQLDPKKKFLAFCFDIMQTVLPSILIDFQYLPVPTN